MNDLTTEGLKALASTAGGYALKASAALGVASGFWAWYGSSGLPVPATLYQVELKLQAVRDDIRKSDDAMGLTIKGLQVDALESQRTTIRLSKAFLRNERAATARTLVGADDASKVSLNRRVAEIDDQLRDLETDDTELRVRINGMKPR